jgi:acyl-CoA synthetase (AMP-forming)/AMP-acid ligase II
MSRPQVSKSVAALLDPKSEEGAIWFKGAWCSWGWVARFAAKLREILEDAGAATSPVALIARNRPYHVAALAGQLADARTTIMIYSAQSNARMAADVRTLKPPVVLADEEDWTPELKAAAEEVRALGIAIADQDAPSVRVVVEHHVQGGGAGAETAFQLHTSGTTGPPKRAPLAWAALDAVVEDAKLVYAPPSGDMSAAQRATIVVSPLGNVSGVAYVVAPIAFGRPIALLEKFTIPDWLEAVRLHKPARTALPATAIRMILDAKAPPADLESLKIVGTGGAPVDPDLQALFEKTYDLAILPAFGATEFGGVIANWTLDMHREFAVAKRGSAGRARPGCQLRIVDPETSETLPAGAIGLLEAITPRTGAGWVRTNDRARIDADGFLFLHGRVDNAIMRGGFKIVPDSVSEVLRQHPAVVEAVVFGVPDARLGESPVAVVQARAPVTEGELAAFAREKLIAYQVPTAFLVVDELPLNASLKPSIEGCKELYAKARS